jgi:hypothetical protein
MMKIAGAHRKYVEEDAAHVVAVPFVLVRVCVRRCVEVRGGLCVVMTLVMLVVREGVTGRDRRQRGAAVLVQQRLRQRRRLWDVQSPVGVGYLKSRAGKLPLAGTRPSPRRSGWHSEPLLSVRLAGVRVRVVRMTVVL